MDDDIIYRQFVSTEQELVRGTEMVYASQRVVQKIYMEEGKSLSLHVPKEDIPFQQSHQANQSNPVLLGLVTPEQKPVRIMPTHNLPCFAHLQPMVWPLFTSQDRLAQFALALKDNLFVVPPKCLISFFTFSDEIGRLIAEGHVVINPLPEICMGRFPYLSADGVLNYIGL